jgi:hypothetical protein
MASSTTTRGFASAPPTGRQLETEQAELGDRAEDEGALATAVLRSSWINAQLASLIQKVLKHTAHAGEKHLSARPAYAGLHGDRTRAALLESLRRGTASTVAGKIGRLHDVKDLLRALDIVKPGDDEPIKLESGERGEKDTRDSRSRSTRCATT